MAAPYVLGAIAAFLSIRREFVGQPEKVKHIFLDSATIWGREKYFQGHGLVDLMRAIQSIQKPRPRFMFRAPANSLIGCVFSTEVPSLIDWPGCAFLVAAKASIAFTPWCALRCARIVRRVAARALCYSNF
jgi:hypothetical protein